MEFFHIKRPIVGPPPGKYIEIKGPKYLIMLALQQDCKGFQKLPQAFTLKIYTSRYK